MLAPLTLALLLRHLVTAWLERRDAETSVPTQPLEES
ncbi:hypothetical protein SAMN05443572_103248 [Myxococcus fulvus]|uniref:Uncharacterized protein n=1 Tax=Myxococcus fulvus TaxID=33 RepID=A0ABY1C8A9_MYXFU|nr:hypothetical protein SAMN05443572_103248 [Myxococcus fulvus]